jgi:hypothetical protein
MSSMRTAFSNWLNENGFFDWVEWGRLSQMGWTGTAFWTGLNGDAFFDWVESERLINDQLMTNSSFSAIAKDFHRAKLCFSTDRAIRFPSKIRVTWS